MTDHGGPPQQPFAQYPGPAGYPPGPPRQAPQTGKGALVTVITLLVVLLAGTVGAAIYDHGDPDSTLASQQLPGDPGGGSGGAQQGTVRIPGQASASYSYPQAGSSGVPGGNGPAPAPAPETTSASPTVPPLDMGAVRRTVEAFFNGFQDHDLHAVRSAVCPKYRNLYQGTYWKPHGYEFNGWHATIRSPLPELTYTYALVTVHLRNPRTGTPAGTMTHNWVVQRIDVDYYICGYAK